MGCRKLLQLIVLIVSFIISMSVIAIIYKPPVLIDPIKQFLNYPYTFELPKHSDADYKISMPDVKNPGLIVLSEDQIFGLVNASLPNSRIERIELEENRIILIKNIASSGKPLWLVVELTISNNQYTLDSIGFGRYRFPKQVQQKVAGFLGDGIAKTILDVFAGQIFSLLDPKYTVIQKDKVEIKLMELNSSKFQILVDGIVPSKYNQGIEETVRQISESIKNFQNPNK